VVVAAAEFGLKVTEAAGKLIWDATGMSNKPYMYAFMVDQVKASSSEGWCADNLADGDTICFKSTPRSLGDGYSKTQMYLTLKHSGTWWKAVTVHKPENIYEYEMVNVQDDKHVDGPRLVDYNDMINKFIVLSKAKFLGVHTNVYWIKNSYDLMPTSDWTIEWK